MITFSYILMTLLMISGLFLIGLILLQRGRGGGLAGAFGGMGGQSAFGAKAGDVFTRITIGVATAWILLCAGNVIALHRAEGGRTNPSIFKDDTKTDKKIDVPLAPPAKTGNEENLTLPPPAAQDKPADEDKNADAKKDENAEKKDEAAKPQDAVKKEESVKQDEPAKKEEEKAKEAAPPAAEKPAEPDKPAAPAEKKPE